MSEFLRARSRTPFHISGSTIENEGIETLSLSRLNAVLFYEPEEMIISVQAGILLKELQKILAEKGQWIPTLSSESSEQTLGAAVAMDHFHPRSRNCGALRTTILGGTFCTTIGEIFKSGSRVVKSVAGYDIHRAFCGSRGHFGIILDLTLKVQPIPEIFYRFFAPVQAREKLLKFHPVSFEEFDGKLLVELAGYREDLKNDLDTIQTFGISIEEFTENDWTTTVQDLIQYQDGKRSTVFSPEVGELLRGVQNVFDPEGMLV